MSIVKDIVRKYISFFFAHEYITLQKPKLVNIEGKKSLKQEGSIYLGIVMPSVGTH